MSFEDKYIGDAKGASISKFCDAKDAGGDKGGDLNGGIKGGALSASGGRTYLKDAKLAKKVRELTAQAFRLHGLRGVCRVDFLFDPKRKKLYLNEINTIPGSLAFYFWTRAGMNTIAFVDRLIKIAKTANARKAELKDEYITKLLK